MQEVEQHCEPAVQVTPFERQPPASVVAAHWFEPLQALPAQQTSEARTPHC
jgi:hypothetical protein